MYSPEYKPLLRQIDLIPGEFQGQPVFFLRDPLGFVEEVVALPQGAVYLMRFMDGEHDLRDLQVEATKLAGQLIPLEEIIKLVQFLDEKGFLWSQKFEELKEKTYQAWFNQRLRPMAHANSAYPLEEGEARLFVEHLLSFSQNHSPNPPRILIAPHIDLRVGAKTYAESYNKFKIPSGSRVIILGVGHYLDFPFSVLTKDLATPFGILRNDRGGLLYLTRSKNLELFPDHMAHKLEHSIEFQALILHYLKGDEVVVLPFLIGAFRVLKENEELLDKLLEGLLELLDEKTYFVLGIDFCHLGLRYGDPFPLDHTLAERALSLDRKLLELTFEGNSKELERLILENEHMKVCGASTLYVIGKLIEKGGFKGNGEIFYQEMLPFGEGSGVSVASAGYFF